MYSSPNRRPPEGRDATRLRQAAEQKHAARVELDKADKELQAAVVAALKHGASHREVAALAGVHERTVLRWGHANGWPTEEQKAQRASRTRQARREELGLDEVWAMLERHSRALGLDDDDTRPAGDQG